LIRLSKYTILFNTLSIKQQRKFVLLNNQKK
jgi:autonomous glycyl radical cofactor GrcA